MNEHQPLMHDPRELREAPEPVARTVKFVRENWDPAYVEYGHDWIPWTNLARPLSESRIALLSTGGFYLRDAQTPFDAAHRHGDTSVRTLPGMLLQDMLSVAHEHYDHKYVDDDFNVALPATRLQQLAAVGVVGSVAAHHYSIQGYITRFTRLLSESVPKILQQLRHDRADALVLVPV